VHYVVLRAKRMAFLPPRRLWWSWSSHECQDAAGCGLWSATFLAMCKRHCCQHHALDLCSLSAAMQGTDSSMQSEGFVDEFLQSW